MTHIHALTWALRRVIIDVTDDAFEQPFLCKPQGPQLLSGATRRAATLVIPEHAPVLILPDFFTYPNCELLDFTYPNLIIFARQEIAHAKGN